MKKLSSLSLSLLAACLVAGSTASQDVQDPVISAPFNSSWRPVNFGFPKHPGGLTWGSIQGMSMDAGAKEIYFFGHGMWRSMSLYRVTLQRSAAGKIVGFAGAAVEIPMGIPITSDVGDVAIHKSTIFWTTPISSPLLHQMHLPTRKTSVVDIRTLGVSPNRISGVTITRSNPARIVITDRTNGEWYDAPLTPTTSGTFDVGRMRLSNAPSGLIVGVTLVPPGAPGFKGAHGNAVVLFGDWIGIHALTANGTTLEDPKVNPSQYFAHPTPNLRYYNARHNTTKGMAYDSASGDLVFHDRAIGFTVIQRGQRSCGLMARVPDPRFVGVRGAIYPIPTLTMSGCLTPGETVTIGVRGTAHARGLLNFAPFPQMMRWPNGGYVMNLVIAYPLQIPANGRLDFPIKVPLLPQFVGATAFLQASLFTVNTIADPTLSDGVGLYVR